MSSTIPVPRVMPRGLVAASTASRPIDNGRKGRAAPVLLLEAGEQHLAAARKIQWPACIRTHTLTTSLTALYNLRCFREPYSKWARLVGYVGFSTPGSVTVKVVSTTDATGHEWDLSGGTGTAARRAVRWEGVIAIGSGDKTDLGYETITVSLKKEGGGMTAYSYSAVVFPQPMLSPWADSIVVA